MAIATRAAGGFMALRWSLVGGTLLVIALAMPACSGGGESGGSEGPPGCASTGKRICERACACGNSECKTGYANSFGSFTTFTWSDRADCEGAYSVSRCKNGGSPAVDYAACSTNVEATQCNGDVFVVPSQCEAPKDAGG